MSRATWITLLTTTLLGLVAMVAWPQVMIMPGPLASHHHAQQADCFTCHTPLRGTPEAKCLACHALAGIGLLTTTGQPLPVPTWRSNLIHNVQPGTCMDCHFEHYLKGRPAQAEHFPHEILSPALLDSCGACHAAQMPQNQFHAFPATTCMPCHNLTRWDMVKFDHSRFVLDRAHNVACAICHTATTGFTGYTCYGCHTHTPANMQSMHVGVPMNNVPLNNCVVCHRVL